MWTTVAQHPIAAAVTLIALVLGAWATRFIMCNEGFRRFCYAMWKFMRIGIAYSGAKGKTEEEKAAAKKALSEKLAPQALALVLELGGYYVKIGQMAVGGGMLPDEWEDAFAPLLDDVPPQPFSRVKEIVEAELQCSIDTAFASFDEAPVGSASIGQVHRAVLKDGTKVVVKVQYPEVERFFSVDLGAISMLTKLSGAPPELMENFEKFSAGEAEFDFTKEAAYLRRIGENVMPYYGTAVFIPEPCDAAWCAAHPKARPGHMATLCTRKVLVMEAVEGAPIRAKMRALMEQWAAAQGKSVEDLRAEHKALLQDSEKLSEALAQQDKAASQLTLDVAAAVVRGSDVLTNAGKLAYNTTVGLASSAAAAAAAPLPGANSAAARKALSPFGGGSGSYYEYKWSELPVNGPRVLRLLFEVHAHQIFCDGTFNSDPHAGNVLMMADGRLGLVDYGSIGELSLQERVGFAKVLIAIADERPDDELFSAMVLLGYQSKGDPTLMQGANARHIAKLYAFLFFKRGWNEEDVYEKCGLPRSVDLMGFDKYCISKDKVVLPATMLNLYRCSNVLLALGKQTGAGGLSTAAMLKAPATRFLDAMKSADLM